MQSSFFRSSDCLIPLFSGSSTLQLGTPNRAATSIVQMAMAITGAKMPRSTLRNGMMDGIFGSETDTTVRQFQTSNKLKVDGTVGQKTITALDQFLAPFRLPPAPSQTPQFVIPPPKIDVSAKLRPLKQPDDHACWAASGTMAWESRNPALVPPASARWSPTERILDLLKRVDAKFPATPTKYQDIFKNKIGLSQDNNVQFLCNGVGLRQPAHTVQERVFGIFGWLNLLNLVKAPIPAISVRMADVMLVHMFMITGADSTRSVPSKMPSTVPSLKGLEFLNAGVIQYFDPFEGKFDEMSIADADARLGVLPDFVPTEVQYRARVFI